MALELISTGSRNVCNHIIDIIKVTFVFGEEEVIICKTAGVLLYDTWPYSHARKGAL